MTSKEVTAGFFPIADVYVAKMRMLAREILPLHPSVALCVWLLALLAVQGVSESGAVPAVLAVAIGTFVAGGEGVARRALHLIWRSRWLLLTLAVVFSWGVPGEAFGGWAWGPSQEGVLTATLHVFRLIMSLVLVAGLLSSLPDVELIAAIYVLCAPLRRFGRGFEQGLVRVLLVLRLIDEGPARDWRFLLRDEIQSSASVSVHTAVEITTTPLRKGDRVLIGGCLLCLLGMTWQAWSCA